MTITKDPLAEIPFVTNMSVGPADFRKFTISNFDGSVGLDVRGAIAEFYFYESVLSNTISATVVLVDTGYIANSDVRDGEEDKEEVSAKKTPGLLSLLNLRGGERVDFEIVNSNPLSQPDRTSSGDVDLASIEAKNGVISVYSGMYINRIRDLGNVSQKDMFALDLVPIEYIQNEKVRVTGKYEGKISENIRSIIKKLNPKPKPGTPDKPGASPMPLAVDSTAFDYNFIGNDRKPFYICTWLASKAVPEGVDDKGKPLSGGGAGYLFFQTKEFMCFRSIDKLLSKDPLDFITKKPIKKYIYNNTGSAQRLRNGEDYQNILSYSFNKTIDIAKDLTLGSYNNRSIFFDPLSMNYQVVEFKFDDQKINYTNKLRSIPKVENITDSPTRLMSHVLDTGVMPSGSSSNAQLKAWKDDQTANNYDAKNIMVQSIMRYNQLFSIQLNIVVPGDFSITAGSRIQCDFADLTHSDKPSNQLSGIYMVASVCHKATTEDTFTSLDLVSDSLYGKKPNN